MTLYIYPNKAENFRLKLAEEQDCEDLRTWKNANKQFFFHKQDITPEQQAAWFAKHQKDKFNYMFMVQEKTEDTDFKNIGCMGFRFWDESVLDVYNIMRGPGEEHRIPNSPYSMALAFNAMNNFIVNTYKLPVQCQVLTTNPTRNWYEKLAFEFVEEREDHVLYHLNSAKLQKVELKIEGL